VLFAALFAVLFILIGRWGGLDHLKSSLVLDDLKSSKRELSAAVRIAVIFGDSHVVRCIGSL
jgi:hypothetical protein